MGSVPKNYPRPEWEGGGDCWNEKVMLLKVGDTQFFLCLFNLFFVINLSGGFQLRNNISVGLNDQMDVILHPADNEGVSGPLPKA